MDMFHMTEVGALFLHFLFDIQIKIRLRLQHNSKFSTSFDKAQNKIREAQTSVFGSNMFFNSKHSLGSPTGSEPEDEATRAGRAEAASAACPLTGRPTACWFGGGPLITGTPRDPAILQNMAIYFSMCDDYYGLQSKMKIVIKKQTLWQCRCDPIFA